MIDQGILFFLSVLFYLNLFLLQFGLVFLQGQLIIETHE